MGDFFWRCGEIPFSGQQPYPPPQLPLRRKSDNSKRQCQEPPLFHRCRASTPLFQPAPRTTATQSTLSEERNFAFHFYPKQHAVHYFGKIRVRHHSSEHRLWVHRAWVPILALTLVNSGTLCYVTSFLCTSILSSAEWVLVSVKHIKEFLTLLVFIIGTDRYVLMGALNIIVEF